jgi:hypothetical protein
MWFRCSRDAMPLVKLRWMNWMSTCPVQSWSLQIPGEWRILAGIWDYRGIVQEVECRGQQWGGFALWGIFISIMDSTETRQGHGEMLDTSNKNPLISSIHRKITSWSSKLCKWWYLFNGNIHLVSGLFIKSQKFGLWTCFCWTAEEIRKHEWPKRQNLNRLTSKTTHHENIESWNWWAILSLCWIWIWCSVSMWILGTNCALKRWGSAQGIQETLQKTNKGAAEAPKTLSNGWLPLNWDHD